MPNNKEAGGSDAGRVNVGRWVDTFVNPLSTRTAQPDWFTPFGSDKKAAAKNRLLLHVLGLMTFYGSGAYLARRLGGGVAKRDDAKLDAELRALTEAQSPSPARLIGINRRNPFDETKGEKEGSEKLANAFTEFWSGVGESVSDIPKRIFQEGKDALAPGVAVTAESLSYVAPLLAATLAAGGGYRLADKIMDRKTKEELEGEIEEELDKYRRGNLARLLETRGVELPKTAMVKTAQSDDTPEKFSGLGPLDWMGAVALTAMALSGYAGYRMGDAYWTAHDPRRRRRELLVKELKNKIRLDEPPKLMARMDPRLRKLLDENSETRKPPKAKELKAPEPAMAAPVDVPSMSI